MTIILRMTTQACEDLNETAHAARHTILDAWGRLNASNNPDVHRLELETIQAAAKQWEQALIAYANS